MYIYIYICIKTKHIYIYIYIYINHTSFLIKGRGLCSGDGAVLRGFKDTVYRIRSIFILRISKFGV